jgi:hypothetical protein
MSKDLVGRVLSQRSDAAVEDVGIEAGYWRRAKMEATVKEKFVWDVLIEVQWFSVSILISLMVGGAAAVILAFGNRSVKELHWRWVKFFSTLFGGVAVLLVLLNYFVFVRNSITTLPTEGTRLVPIKLQFVLTYFTMEMCADARDSIDCTELKRVTKEYLDGMGYNTSKDYAGISPPKLEGRYKDLLPNLRRQFERHLEDQLAYNVDDVSFEIRKHSFVLSAILAMLATIGALGEAAFQIRKSRESQLE